VIVTYRFTDLEKLFIPSDLGSMSSPSTPKHNLKPMDLFPFIDADCVDTTLVFVDGDYDAGLSTVLNQRSKINSNQADPQQNVPYIQRSDTGSSTKDQHEITLFNGALTIIPHLKQWLNAGPRQQGNSELTNIYSLNMNDTGTTSESNLPSSECDYVSLIANNIPELKELPRDAYGSRSLCGLNLVSALRR
jgi:hypothetical protein